MTFHGNWNKVLKAFASLLSENVSINLRDDRDDTEYSTMCVLVASFFPPSLQNHKTITTEALLKIKCFPIFFFLFFLPRKGSSSPTFAKCVVSLISWFEFEKTVGHISVSQGPPYSENPRLVSSSSPGPVAGSDLIFAM